MYAHKSSNHLLLVNHPLVLPVNIVFGVWVLAFGSVCAAWFAVVGVARCHASLTSGLVTVLVTR